MKWIMLIMIFSVLNNPYYLFSQNLLENSSFNDWSFDLSHPIGWDLLGDGYVTPDDDMNPWGSPDPTIAPWELKSLKLIANSGDLIKVYQYFSTCSSKLKIFAYTKMGSNPYALGKISISNAPNSISIPQNNERTIVSDTIDVVLNADGHFSGYFNIILDNFADIVQSSQTAELNIDEIGLYEIEETEETRIHVTSFGKTVNAFTLYQNYPNPANPTTTIVYTLPEATDILIQVFDVRGRLVQTLVSGTQESGRHTVLWNGADDKGIAASSGMYFCRLTATEKVLTRKMLLVR